MYTWPLLVVMFPGPFELALLLACFAVSAMIVAGIVVVAVIVIRRMGPK